MSRKGLRRVGRVALLDKKRGIHMTHNMFLIKGGVFLGLVLLLVLPKDLEYLAALAANTLWLWRT